jgi:hypothetical protein
VRRAGVEPARPGGHGVTDRLAHRCRPTQSSSTGGSRTHSHRGLSSAALPVCTPCRRQRPVRDSNPSHLLDKQAVTPASSQGVRQSARRESNPRDRRGRAVGYRYITGTFVQSTWRESNPRLRLGMPTCYAALLQVRSRPSRGGRIRTHTGPVWRRPCCRYTTPLFSEARGT